MRISTDKGEETVLVGMEILRGFIKKQGCFRTYIDFIE